MPCWQGHIFKVSCGTDHVIILLRNGEAIGVGDNSVNQLYIPEPFRFNGSFNFNKDYNVLEGQCTELDKIRSDKEE